MGTKQGCLLFTGSMEQIEEAFLVLEKKVLFGVKATESVVTLFSVFGAPKAPYIVFRNRVLYSFMFVYIQCKLQNTIVT